MVEVVTHLMSPGTMATARHDAELTLVTVVDSAVRQMVKGVQRDARRALDAPTLLAAGRLGRGGRGGSPTGGVPGVTWSPAGAEPFSLGKVIRRWGVVVEAVLGPLARLIGRDPEDVDTAYDPYLVQAKMRLAASDLPTSIYDSAQAVLAASQAQQWDVYTTRARLLDALAMDTPAVRQTPEGVEDAPGVSWDAQIARIARTQATAAVGHRTVRELATQGVPRKRWVAYHDARTRPSHREADGQTAAVSQAFVVNGYSMMAPGDPTAPYSETENCRCIVVGVP